MTTDHVAALKRQRAHLLATHADKAKLAENAYQLRLAGVDPDELDNEEPKEAEVLKDRHSAKRQTADAPTAPRRTSKDAAASKSE
jgi:hypothetical protein